MPRVLITGMSGTGKSTVLAALAERGHRTVDADGDAWSHWGTGPDGEPDWMWREDRMAELLAGHADLFVAGTSVNQGGFYDRFERVVLLSAPAEVMLARIAARTNNPYGKSDAERAAVLRNLAEVEPLLRAGADVEIDTARPVAEVVEAVLAAG
ncbi:MAG TPA: AAA family ATPase [Phytomonospora sp.]